MNEVTASKVAFEKVSQEKAGQGSDLVELFVVN